MLNASIVEQVRQLLIEEKLSQRQVARQLGVSRSSVQAIAQGRHTRDVRPAAAEQPWSEPVGPLQRCPTCGGRVLMPCLLCYVRGLQERHRQRCKAARSKVQPGPGVLVCSVVTAQQPASTIAAR